jgi:ribosomal protein S18 acetylase RimI-like enzyme
MPSDAEDLTRLRGYMHLAMGDTLNDAWHVQCLEVFARRLATDDFVAFVVEDEGVLVAGGTGWVEEHLPSPYALQSRRGHIASVSTDPAHRRKGHARLVFQALMDWMVEQDLPRVDLRATPDGQPLYASFGFRVLGGATMAWNAPGSRPGMLA